MRTLPICDAQRIGERRAATEFNSAAMLPARAFHLKLGLRSSRAPQKLDTPARKSNKVSDELIVSPGAVVGVQLDRPLNLLDP